MSIENLVGLVFVPIMLAVMAAIWKKIDGVSHMVRTETGKLWIDVAGFKEAYARNRLEDERRYVNRQDLADFREEVKDSLSDVKKAVDRVADKLDEKRQVGRSAG